MPVAVAGAMQSPLLASALLLHGAFGGISSALRALYMPGVTPGMHVASELGAYAQRVVSNNFQGEKEFGNLQRADLATLSAGILNNPHLQRVLRVADLPCRSLSEANLQRHGSQGTDGSLIFDCGRVDNKVLRLVLPDVCGETLVENIFPMMVRCRPGTLSGTR